MIERQPQARLMKSLFRPPTVSIAPIRILIADGNYQFRSKLQSALSEEGDMMMVGECDDGLEVVPLCGVAKPHVILIDLHLPRMDGVEITDRLSQLAPHTKILIISEQDDPHVLETIRKGASGFLLKDIGISPMIAAMRMIAYGGVYIHPILMRRVVEELRRLSHKEQVFQYLYSTHSPISWQEVLTYREMEVLRLISQGKSNRTISEDLFISEKTVKNHVSNILYKMNVQDRTQAVLLAIKYGWVQLI